jgi:hypothetical protein
MRTTAETGTEDLVGTCFAFGDLSDARAQNRGYAFRPIGLASLQPASMRPRRDTGTPGDSCLLSSEAHAHVHTIVLDLAPMEDPSTPLNWPAELKALAETPDNTAVVAGLQARLRDCSRGLPSVDTRLIVGRGLVWRNGSRVPVSGTYEHIRTTLPLVTFLETNHVVAAAFGRCLADPVRHQSDFLQTCVEAAGLKEQQAMLARVPEEQRAHATDALYGNVDLESGIAVIIALPG